VRSKEFDEERHLIDNGGEGGCQRTTPAFLSCSVMPFALRESAVNLLRLLDAKGTATARRNVRHPSPE
jgi:hypothetical protein